MSKDGIRPLGPMMGFERGVLKIDSKNHKRMIEDIHVVS